MDRRYPPLDPRSHSPGSPAAQAMEAAERARMQPPFAMPPGEPAAGLTPAQRATLMSDRQETLFDVLGTRMEIANLRRERLPRAIQSTATLPTEARAKLYFDSASDGTLGAVDAHLRGLENYLRDPGTAAGGKYDYRDFTPAEIKLQQDDIAGGGEGFAALRNTQSPNSVGVNYPLYSRGSDQGRRVTQAHEGLHVAEGFSLGQGEELYNEDAIERAEQPGGTNWAVNKNADNTAMFTVRRWPFGRPTGR